MLFDIRKKECYFYKFQIPVLTFVRKLFIKKEPIFSAKFNKTFLEKIYKNQRNPDEKYECTLIFIDRRPNTVSVKGSLEFLYLKTPETIYNIIDNFPYSTNDLETIASNFDNISFDKYPFSVNTKQEIDDYFSLYVPLFDVVANDYSYYKEIYCLSLSDIEQGNCWL